MTNGNGQGQALPPGSSQPIDVESFLAWNPVMPRELIGKGILYEGMKMIMYGRYKTFKSMLAYWSLWRMRDGQDILGLPVDKQGVSSLYMQAEVADPLMWNRASKMFAGMPKVTVPNRQSMYIWNTMRSGLKLDTAEGIRILDEVLGRLAPLDLVVLDPLYKYMSLDITSPAAVDGFQTSLDKLIVKHNVAFWILAHPRKPPRDGKDGEGNVDDLLGASTWANWADTVLKVTKPANQPQDTFVLKNEQVSRHAEEEIPDVAYAFDRQTLQFRPTVLT